MTETEARTKKCPFGVHSTCIASDCMGWRLMSPLTPEDGYCGPAGRPVRLFERHHDEDYGQ